MKTRNTIICLFASALFLFTVLPAQAHTLGFYNIFTEDSDPNNAAIGVAQLFVDVTDAGSNQALFTFGNTGPDDSSICAVYFDDVNTLLGFASIDNTDTGVSFSGDGNPPNQVTPGDLPGGNEVGFTADYLFDSDTPAQRKGVNPGEYLGILFDLKDGLTFTDLLSKLGDGSLLIGIHVLGFENEGSESFINSAPIPEPATMLLFGSGLIGIAVSGKKRFKKRNG